MSFWQQFNKTIIGLSPMDGITDFAFRSMVAKFGKPDLMFTEFVNVNAVLHTNFKTEEALLFSDQERPIIAQLFGNEPEQFYNAAKMVAQMGFDGIDINMGCPAKKVSSHGSGAGLIRTPDLAREIIKAVKQAVIDLKLEIPVSVKTRIGYDSEDLVPWLDNLLQEKPVAITVHGRTLKQMYSGFANWDVIKKGADFVHKNAPGTIFLGNGDISSIQDGIEKSKANNTDGFLVGRAAIGHPWIFSENPTEFSLKEVLKIIQEHAELLVKTKSPQCIVQIRKHISPYLKGFPQSKELKVELMSADSLEALSEIIEKNT